MPYDDGPALEDRWTDVFRRDTLVHLGMMGSIVMGTFQGYLKDRLPGLLPYALAELFFVAAFVAWFGTLVIRHLPLRGPGIVPGAVLTAILVPTMFLLHPGSPLVLKVAGLRAWAEFPIACLMALSVIQSRGQARAYVGLILALCAITAVYGIVQYRAGPDVALSGELARIRHGPTVFYRVAAGHSEFRAFSTFTFPAPFAGMMVFGSLLAAAVALSAVRSMRQRLLAAVLIPLFFIGMTVSGTRAALIILLLGLLIMGRYRGLTLRQLLLVPVGLVALYGATTLTAGTIVARWQSMLLDEGALWRYVYAPITIAQRALAQAPFGLGLGRSGVGVPYRIMRSYPPGYIVGSDGDIGRAAVEMGIFGLVLLVLILVALLPYAARATRALVGTPAEDLALGAGALVLANGILILIGSPLSSTPHATIWWFFLGTLLRLTVLDDGETGKGKGETSMTGHLAAEPLEQSNDKPDRSSAVTHGFTPRLTRNQVQLRCNLQVQAQLVRGSQRDPQMPHQLRAGSQTVPFGNIGRHRQASSAELLRQPEVGSQRFLKREAVNVDCQLAANLPSLQRLKFVHAANVRLGRAARRTGSSQRASFSLSLTFPVSPFPFPPTGCARTQ